MKLRIALANIESNHRAPAYQLGLLASYALTDPEVRKNINFQFLSFSASDDPKDIAKQLMAVADVDLIATSHYAWNYLPLDATLRLLGEANVRLPRVVLGGPNCAGTFGEDFLRRHRVVSALVEGEGEPAFLEICRKLVDSPSNNPFVGTANCRYLLEDDSIHEPGELVRMDNLDVIPSPYVSGLLPTNPALLFWETNRGCPYRCSFCYWGNGGAKVFRLSMDRVREDLSYFMKKGVRALWVCDANFGMLPRDTEIAELAASLNAEHSHALRYFIVNWAKSADNAIKVAKIFKKGRMNTATTMALQSLTPEAEEIMQRYSISPGNFKRLVREAADNDLDTYTDIIWGLPGENYEQLVDGLDAVMATGLPAINQHSLLLLPGTQYWEKRKELGMTMYSETDLQDNLSSDERSPYAALMVVSHPNMSREERVAGSRYFGPVHLFHNLNLGQIVNFFLAGRYGIRTRDVMLLLDSMVLGQEPVDFSPDASAFIQDAREIILRHASTVASEPSFFIRQLSQVVWLSWNRTRTFFREFYTYLIDHKYKLCSTEAERQLLVELVDFNFLISPKPGWMDTSIATFSYDFKSIMEGMWNTILSLDFEEPKSRLAVLQNEQANEPKKSKKSSSDGWKRVPTATRDALNQLLTDEYLAMHRRPSSYRAVNPWIAAPAGKTNEWITSLRSKWIKLVAIEPVREAPILTAV